MKTSSPITATNETTATGETVGMILGRPTCAAPIPPAFARVFQPLESSALPEFCKLPAPRQRCPFTGASRTWLLEHAELGHFTIVRVRKPGSIRGALFVNLPSLLEFLRREMAQQHRLAPAEEAKVTKWTPTTPNFQPDETKRVAETLIEVADAAFEKRGTNGNR